MSQSVAGKTPIEPTRYTRFEAQPLTRSFGAMLTRIQISDALDDDKLCGEVRQAWVKYQVVFLRGQRLTPAQQLALGCTQARTRWGGREWGGRDHGQSLLSLDRCGRFE